MLYDDLIDCDIKELLVDDKDELTFLGCLASVMLSIELLKIIIKIRKGEENEHLSGHL